MDIWVAKIFFNLLQLKLKEKDLVETEILEAMEGVMADLDF